MRTLFLHYADAQSGDDLGSFHRQHVPRVGDHIVLPGSEKAWMVLSVVWREDEGENIVDISLIEDIEMGRAEVNEPNRTLN